MRRLCPLLAALFAVQALTGCDEKTVRGASSSRAAEPREDDREPAKGKSHSGKSFVAEFPLSDAVGAAPEDLTRQGGRMFDGSGFRGGAATTVPDRLPDGRRGVKRVAYTPGDGRRTGDLSVKAPPLPDSDNHRYDASATDGSSREGGQTLLGFAAFQLEQKFPSVAPIMSRFGWKAAKRRGSNAPHSPRRVTVHHTQGKQTMSEDETAKAVKSVQWYHMVGRAREGKEAFDDIGYHFLIAGDGRVVEGRRAEYLGAHAGGANDDNIGVAMMGDFNKVRPTTSQISSLTRLVTFLSLKYKKDPMAKGFLEPHMHYTNTDCPGKNMMAILDSLRRVIDREHDQIADGGSFVPLAIKNA